MYPTLLSIAGFQLSSFSIFFILSWCVFSFVFWKSLREEGVEEERIFDLTFYATLTAMVAARFGFVAFHWDTFADTLLKIVALWVAPGLSLFAGVLAGILVIVALSKRRKIRIGAVLDALGLSLPGALIVGSVGSLLDGSEVGISTRLPWAIHYVGLPDGRHPYQLYMILLLTILLFVSGFLHSHAKRKKWAMGSVGVGFFLLWGVVSFALEFFKEHTVYWWALSVNHWVALALFIASGLAWYRYTGGVFVIRHIIQSMYAKFPKRHS